MELPFVSVVIPMRNESTAIRACLDSVLAQDYPADRMEVIVMDGESDDDSPEVLASYGDRIRVLQNPGRIVPFAMNIGIRAAKGEIITRVDAHTTLEPSYIRVGVETLQRTGADNVGGLMRCNGGSRAADAIAYAMSSRFGIGSQFHFATEECEADTVYMGMYPRAVFGRIGLYDEELVRNQDEELNYRLRKAGGKVFLTPHMHSHYQNRESFVALRSQFYQYGLWKIRVLQKHPSQMSLRHFIPPLFIAGLIVTAVGAPLCPLLGWLFWGAVLAYAAGVSLAASSVARQYGWQYFLPSAAAFAIMHLSWGSGFLVGLFRFARNWRKPEPPPPALDR